jgi:hypothetical protein
MRTCACAFGAKITDSRSRRQSMSWRPRVCAMCAAVIEAQPPACRRRRCNGVNFDGAVDRVAHGRADSGGARAADSGVQRIRWTHISSCI